MKKLALLFCILFAACGIYAQKVVKKGEVINLGKVKYRITYTGKMVVDTLKNPYIYNESEMRLDIGEKVTHFYDRSKEVRDSRLEDCLRQHCHNHGIYLPACQSILQGQNLVCLVF